MSIRLKENEASPLIAINTTPLIDVMLVLLIMLIITIPVELHSINLDTPKKASNEPTTSPPSIEIHIEKSGLYSLNHALLNEKELDQRLLSLSQLPSPPEIHIVPHSQSDFKSLAHLLAQAQNLKLTKIGIDDSQPWNEKDLVKK